MVRRALLALAMLVAAAFPAAAEEGAPAATATVAFAATSTLHDFGGTAAPVSFALRPAGEGFWSAEVELPVASLDTDSDWRDENLRAMFDEPHFPLIRARFPRIDPRAVRDGRSLPFVLEIRNTARETAATVTRWQETADALAFDAEFSVSLRAFGLEAPSSLGFIEVGDSVRVTVHVDVRRI